MSNSMVPGSNGNLRFIADQFARGFQELRDAVNNIQTQVQSGAIDMAGVKVDLDHLQDAVDNLQKLVQGDNGKSISTKLVIIERELKVINEWITDQKEKKSESTKYKIQVKIALIAGSFALLASIISQISQWFF